MSSERDFPIFPLYSYCGDGIETSILLDPGGVWGLPHGQSTWHSPQKVGKYRAYVNQYMVTVPSTFTLV